MEPSPLRPLYIPKLAKEERGARAGKKRRKEEGKRRKKQEKGEEPLAGAPPPATTETTGVELEVPPTKPNRGPPLEKPVFAEKRSITSHRSCEEAIGLETIGPPSGQPRPPPAKPLPPLYSPNSQEQDPATPRRRRNPKSSEKCSSRREHLSFFCPANPGLRRYHRHLRWVPTRSYYNTQPRVSAGEATGRRKIAQNNPGEPV